MSKTSTHPYGTGWPWFRRWFTGLPHQTIGGEHGDPFLLRWFVLPKNPWCNWYLHKFLRSDDDRALHDHPWGFFSLILKNAYTELTPTGSNRRRAGSIAYRSATARHRVILDPTPAQQARYERLDNLLKAGVTSQLPTALFPGYLRPLEQPVWTMVLTGKKVRMWGFWCPLKPAKSNGSRTERFVPWREFGAAGCGEQ